MQEISNQQRSTRSKIAILMATYNDQATIKQAVDSIQNCLSIYNLTGTIFIIDDCSTEPARNQLFEVENVRITRLETNHGLTKALNIGLNLILREEFQFIARMDADDICMPERLIKQVEFLNHHTELGGVGCWAKYIDDKSSETVFNYTPPHKHESMIKSLYFNSCMAHPTWMLRASTFIDVGKYDETYVVAQDYEYLRRVVSKGYKLANIPEYLLKYRISSNGISIKKRKQQLLNRLRTQLKYHNPASLLSWAGLFKTAILVALPIPVIISIKKRFWS